MSSNKLKMIACISMLIDHAGLLLFPEFVFFRYVGRLAMPIFAFFIAEGCIHTRSRLKYLLTVLSVAALSQAVYFAEDLMDGRIDSVDLNILFTFVLSIILCSTYLGIVEAERSRGKAVYTALFVLSAVSCVFLCLFLNELLPFELSFDYGIAGVALPLFAVISKDSSKRLAVFFVGLVCFNLVMMQDCLYTWISVLSVPFLLYYDGTRGTHRLKYFFYLFYPVHFAVLYLVKIFAF